MMHLIRSLSRVAALLAILAIGACNRQQDAADRREMAKLWIKQLEQPDSSNWQLAEERLVPLGKAAVPELIAFLEKVPDDEARGKSPRVYQREAAYRMLEKTWAARVLGAIGPPAKAAIDPLVDAVKDNPSGVWPESEFHKTALEAIKKIGG
jgi:HEAT repeat protein